MELTSQEAEIPMPLNSAYGGGVPHGHGHMTHHHQHHYHHNHHHQKQHQQDPPLSSSTTSSHNHNIIPPPPPSTTTHNTSNGVGTMPSSTNGGTPAGTAAAALDLEGGQQHQQVPPYDNNRDCNPNSNSASADVAVVTPSAATKTKLVIRYRECQKNHAAAMGGNATDGCGEFMPSGEEGTLEALTCSACNCHRNFHRKEIEGGGQHDQDHQHHHQGGDHHHQQYYPPPSHHPFNYHPTPHSHHIVRARKGFLGYPTGGVGAGAAVNVIPVSRAVPLNNIPYQVGPGAASGPSDDQSDDHDHDHDHRNHHHHHHHHPPQQLVKKRFRTKFSQEQKEKMLEFAEKVGWKIQKQEESVVQQFCQEVGVKRRVLKVWMHNNKHTFANKINNINNTTTTSINPPN